jgi:transposase
MRKPKSAAEHGFDRYDKRRLRRALERAVDVRTYRRVHAVLSVAQGQPVREVARLACAALRTVYAWVTTYVRTHRPQSLEDAPRPGRPPVAPAITDARIRREFGRDPLRLGYNTTAWTAPLLAHHLGTRYGQSLGAGTLRRRMRSLGLRWKRPRHAYGTKDPNRAQKKGGLYAA